MFKKICQLLEIYLLQSLLNRTTPITRILFCMVLCLSLFINSVLTLAIISLLVLLISLSDPETISRHLYLLLLTFIFTLSLLFIETMYPDSLSSFLGWSGTEGKLSILKMMWKIVIVIFGAMVFIILVPQTHIVYALRKFKWPQLWISTIAAFRATEIGYFAFVMVRRTQISKQIRIWPPNCTIHFIDSFMTGFFGHIFHIVNEFELSIRSKGVESECYTPVDEIPAFGYGDLSLYAVMASLIFMAVKGT